MGCYGYKTSPFLLKKSTKQWHDRPFAVPLHTKSTISQASNVLCEKLKYLALPLPLQDQNSTELWQEGLSPRSKNEIALRVFPVERSQWWSRLPFVAEIFYLCLLPATSRRTNQKFVANSVYEVQTHILFMLTNHSCKLLTITISPGIEVTQGFPILYVWRAKSIITNNI